MISIRIPPTGSAVDRSKQLLGRLAASRVAWSFLAPLALVGTFFLFQARFGFNPTDDGFVLNQAWRLANGDAPHLNFASPRPLGSAFLHLPVVFLETHMLAVSRLLVLFQFLWIAFALVDSFSRLSRPISPFAKFGLVTVSFLINLGTWPVMAWHTVDGIFLGASALWMATLRYQKTSAIALQWSGVWLLAGFAVLVKQPYILVPVLMTFLVTSRTWKHALATSPLVAVPATLYFIAFGGLSGELLPQLYSGSGQELFRPVQSLGAVLLTRQGPLAIVVIGGSIVLSRLLRNSASFWQIAPVAIPGGFGLAMAHVQAMPIWGLWPFTVTVMFMAASFLATRDHRQRLFIAATLGIGFAASLSWGAPAPSLLAGSYLALTVYLLSNFNRTARPRSTESSFPVAVAVLALAAVYVSVTARDTNVYREPPRAQLVAEIRHPNFDAIRVSPQAASYVESVIFCSGK